MFYGIILVIFVVFAVIAMRVNASVGFEKKKSFIEQIFFNAAAFLYRIFFRRSKTRSIVQKNVERVKLFLIVFVAGDIIAMLLWISSGQENLLVDGVYIIRKKAGEGSTQVLLAAKNTLGEIANIAISVEECRYEEEELQLLYEEMIAEIEVVALQENSSWDQVTSDLLFMEEMEGYPFILTWSSDNYQFLTESGEVAEWSDIIAFEEQTALVTIQLRAAYLDFVREHIFYARVCPLEEERNFLDVVEYSVKEAVKESANLDKLVLPTEVQGEVLEWTEKQEDSSKTVFLLGMVGGFAVCFFSDRDLQKQREKQGAEMEAEYPAIISKLTLYLGAGMNLKGAFSKIAQESEACTNPIYQEMMITCREIESGIAEPDAYERFGKRVRKQRYIRLTTLMIQNLRKGNAALLLQLKQESYLALEERTMEIKKIGEETGTKLLLPMMLMMAMVMILIMIPAFLSI